MGSHFLLLTCYPLALIAMVFGALGTEGLCYLPVAALVCAAYYVLLLWSLRGCRRVGGWAGRFYQLAGIVVCVHLIPATLLLTGHKSWEDPAFAGVLLTMFAVYACCSLAGAAMALRNGKWIQALGQIMWPTSVFAFPYLPGIISLVPILGFGIQGVHALLLALSLEVPLGESFDPVFAIGWEMPGG